MTGDPASTGPERFGPYELHERLGMGGMAVVHRAKKRGPAGFERSVALKRMLSHLAEDGEFVESFIREAKVASLLVHPNIAQVYDFGRIGGVYYIAMELVAGVDVRRLLRYASRIGEPIPMPALLSILGQLCAAIDYAHSCADEQGTPLGIVHRDISPSNMIIAKTGHLKVIDFGIAKAASRQLHTDSGQVKGKLGYMSPEAALGMSNGAISDVFSMGVVAWELVTTQPLFTARTDFETMRKIRELEVEPPSRHNPDCSPRLDELILAALDRDPDKRLASAAAFREGLEEVARAMSVQPSERALAEWIAHAVEAGTSAEANDETESETAVLRPSGRPQLRRSAEDVALASELWGEDSVIAPEGPDFSSADPGFDRAPLEDPYDVATDDTQPPLPPEMLPEDDRAPVARPSAPPERLSNPAVEPAPAPRGPGLKIVGGIVVVAAALGGMLLWQRTRHPDATATAPAPAATGSLRFEIEPPGAAIAIGGRDVGSTSPFDTDLAPGVYSVQVRKAGFKTWSGTVTVTAGTHQTIDVALTAAAAHLVINSRPAGLPITLDGEPTSYTTPATFDTTPGTHQIEITGPDGQQRTQDVQAAADATQNVMVMFTSPPDGAAGSATPTHGTPPTGRHHHPDPKAGTGSDTHGTTTTTTTTAATSTTPAPPPAPPDAGVPTTTTTTTPQVTKAPPPPTRTAVVPASKVTKIAGSLPTTRGDRAGQALVKMCIDAAGHVSSAKLVRSSGQVPGNLTSVLRTWRYQPYTNQEGAVAPACFALPLQFVPRD